MTASERAVLGVPPRALTLMLTLALGAAASACGAAPEDAAQEPELLAETAPGYPETTSRLTLRLDEDHQKLCHATLIAPGFAITAAHCFSRLDPFARGALNEFGRSLGVNDVVFHPGALRSGATTLESVAEPEDFVAAHDLALVPVAPPLTTVAPASRWLPLAGCTLPSALGVRGRFGQLGPEQDAQTAEATLLGVVPAAALLGPEHPGALLSAQGPSVGPGDSGSGVTSAWEDLEAMAPGCARSADGGDEVLMGVIQDANPDDATLPFGLIPLHLFDHAEWLATTIASAAPAPPAPPRTEP